MRPRFVGRTAVRLRSTNDLDEAGIGEWVVNDVEVGRQPAGSLKGVCREARQPSACVIRRVGDTFDVAASAQFSQRDAVDELQNAERRVAADATHLGVQHARHRDIGAEPRQDSRLLRAGIRRSVVEAHHESLGLAGQPDAVVPIHQASCERLSGHHPLGPTPSVEEFVRYGEAQRRWRRDHLPRSFFCRFGVCHARRIPGS